MQYMLHDPFTAAAVSLQYIVCQLPVQRVALLQQFLYAAAWIGDLEQRPLFVFRSAGQQLINRGGEVNHFAQGFQFVVIFGANNDTSTRGYDMAFHAQQTVERCSLACAKAGFTLNIKDPRNIRACALFNKMIGIDEGVGKAGGKITSDC